MSKYSIQYVKTGEFLKIPHHETNELLPVFFRSYQLANLFALNHGSSKDFQLVRVNWKSSDPRYIYLSSLDVYNGYPTKSSDLEVY